MTNTGVMRKEKHPRGVDAEMIQHKPPGGSVVERSHATGRQWFDSRPVHQVSNRIRPHDSCQITKVKRYWSMLLISLGQQPNAERAVPTRNKGMKDRFLLYASTDVGRNKKEIII